MPMRVHFANEFWLVGCRDIVCADNIVSRCEQVWLREICQGQRQNGFDAAWVCDRWWWLGLLVVYVGERYKLHGLVGRC